MRNHSRTHAISLAVAVLLLTVVLGCQSKTPNYTPSPHAAEAAVKQALESWQAGSPPGEIPGTTPPIHVVDVGRKPGQTLSGFRILGETRGDSGRTLVVSLDLQNPKETLKTKYIVVGIDPLWVFRHEDYELLTHWDHHMPVEPAASDAVPEKSP